MIPTIAKLGLLYIFLFDEAGKTKHVQTKHSHSCIPTTERTERDHGQITTCTLIYSLPLHTALKNHCWKNAGKLSKDDIFVICCTWRHTKSNFVQKDISQFFCFLSINRCFLSSFIILCRVHNMYNRSECTVQLYILPFTSFSNDVSWFIIPPKKFLENSIGKSHFK